MTDLSASPCRSLVSRPSRFAELHPCLRSTSHYWSHQVTKGATSKTMSGECCNSYRLWSRHSQSCPRRNNPQGAQQWADQGHIEVTISSGETTNDKKRPGRSRVIVKRHPVNPGKSPLETFTIV